MWWRAGRPRPAGPFDSAQGKLAGRPSLHSNSKDLLLVAGVVLVLLHNSSLARLLPHLVEFLLGGSSRFLFFFDIGLVLRVVLIILGGVAQAGARISIKGGGAQAMFALIEVEFVVQGVDLLLLLVELFPPVVRRLLAFGSGRGGIDGGRFCGWRGVGVRGPLPSGGSGGRRSDYAQGFVDRKIV